jgi:hypothetical protein
MVVVLAVGMLCFVLDVLCVEWVVVCLVVVDVERIWSDQKTVRRNPYGRGHARLAAN